MGRILNSSIQRGGAIVTADDNTAPSPLIFNGDFEYYPAFIAAQTASNWINGAAAGGASNTYGWYKRNRAGGMSAMFDNTVSHSGTTSMLIYQTSAGGFCTVSNNNDNGGSSVPWG